MQIHEGMERQYREVKQWGYSDVSQEVADLESVRKSRVLMLIERLDDPALRTEIDGMLLGSLAMYTAFTRDEGRQAKGKFVGHWNSVNKALGKVIRESWPH